MDAETLLKILAGLQAGTLISIIAYGYKVVTFFNNIQFKTDLMWKDYEGRISANEFGKYSHSRYTDDVNEANLGHDRNTDRRNKNK